MRVYCLVGWLLSTVLLGNGVAQTETQPTPPTVDDLRLADVNDSLERLERRLGRLEGHQRLAGVQVQSGKVSLPQNFGEEPRPIIRDNARGVQDRVVFPEPFDSVPKVTLAFSMLDIQSGMNTRVWAKVVTVDEAGFDYELFGWADTRIYQAHAVWIAVAQ